MKISRRNLNIIKRVFIALAIYLTHQTAFALPAYEKVPPLFNNGSISIYPESRHPLSNARDWCGSRKYSDAPAKFEVVYDGAHESRDALFPKGYEEFVDTTVRSVIKQQCANNPANVSLYFYRRGEMRHLDVIRFQLRDKKGSNTVSRIAEFANKKHPSYKRLVAANELGKCSGKPFCELTGGIYLNAIYENNKALLRKLDYQIMDEVYSTDTAKAAQTFTAIFSGTYSENNQNVEAFGLKDISLLKFMAEKYLSEYGSNHYRSASGACLQDDSLSITRKFTTPVIHYENQYGIGQGSVGGDTYVKTYTINKEFRSLCNKVCGAIGGAGSVMFEAVFESYKSGLVYDGISQVRTKMDCNSPEVKQFERNLIALTEHSLATPSTYKPSKKVERTDAEKAQDTKKAFMEIMEKRQVQSEAPQTQRQRTPRSRAGTRQAQTTASRHGEVSRMIPSSAVEEMNDLNGNLKAGEQFLAANKNKDGVVETSSGLQYRMIKSGSGRAPKSGDQVTAHMRLTLLNGRVIHDTYAEGKPSTFAPYQSIDGFNEGLKLLRVGGKIELFIPPSLAYGNRAAGDIPAGSTFIYEVELLSIK